MNELRYYHAASRIESSRVLSLRQLAIVAAAVLSIHVAMTCHANDPPNVILILADDMAIGDLSSVNGGRSRTPRLDQLVSQSISFRQAYAASPVCAPSRAALLTGRYPHRTGAVTLNQRKFPKMTRIRLDETTIADRFSAAGYATGLVGKWHSGSGSDYHPLERGFDEFVGFSEAWDVETYFKYRLDIQGEHRDFEGRYLTDVLTEQAIDFVRQHHDRPFFLHLAHYAPHRPLSAPQDLIDQYLAKGLSENTAAVYAMIEAMDHGIGDLLDELDTLGLAKNTLVIFSSDNGPDPLVGDRFNGDNRGTKYMVNEGGIHVPLAFRWKDALTPTELSETVHFIDIMPTLTEICQLPNLATAKPLDGRSFAGLLSDDYGAVELPPRRFWQWNRGQPLYSHNAAVREGDWKLVRPYLTRGIPNAESKAAPRLYSLTQDPTESTDVAVENPMVRDRLLQQLERWTQEVEQDRIRELPSSR